ncbi:MAG: sulfur carrier protein ThiS [Gammaproteobacteria bacterium]
MPDHIEITVNGDPHTIPENTSLIDLLDLLKIQGRLAIDVNGEIIPRSNHSDHLLLSEDRVEIVFAIGGG